MAGHFPDFGLLPELVKATEEMGWMLPTDIQAEAIPLILGGGDVLMAAETGSGKTGAFCLPVIQITYENLRDAKQGKLVAGGRGSAGTTWKMNVNDRDPSFAIAEDGFLCQAREERQWQGCRSNFGVTNGKFYYEATVTDEGLCRVGFSTDAATRDVGTDRESFGFGGTGKKSYAKQFDSYGEPFGINDTIGCFIDLDDYTIKFSKNGKDFGRAFEIPRSLHGSAFFASVTLKNAELRFNFGDTKFRNEPMDGYKPLSKAPSGSIKKSSLVGATPVKFTNVCSPAAIIMEPSRELANQTLDQVTLFKKYLPDPSPKPVLLVGGQNARDQIMSLEAGVDIVVGTPGKLEDFISTQKLKLDQVRFFILDEADGLLAQGQQDLIMRIYNRCPKTAADGKRLQMVICSATLHNFDVKRLAEKIMHFPTWIDLKGQDSVPDTVHHVVCHVDPTQDRSWQSLKHRVKTDGIHSEDKIHPSSSSPETLSEAVKILKAEYLFQAITEHKMYNEQAIIFCRTKLDCDNMERYLIEKGGGNPKTNKYACVCLHSDRSPKERNANLQAFKDKRAKFLICTDVAARGIDVKGIPFVINVTLPDDKANYIHRIGRVGRAERMGLAISLASTVKEKVWYHKCDSRGKNCFNTRLVEHGGCAIWYNEVQYLGDIEEHLGETITAVDRDIKVPVNEFDGKVIYGERRRLKGAIGNYHTAELAPSVNDLALLETKAQNSFLNFNVNWMKASA